MKNMTLINFKANMRYSRGKLKSMDEDLTRLYEFGSGRLLDWSLHNKFIGVKKLADIAEGASHEDQNNFVVWMCEGRRTIGEIDIKILEMI